MGWGKGHSGISDPAEISTQFTSGSMGGALAVVLSAVALAFSGALLQAGMGLMTYTEMGERLDAVVAVIMKGNA